MPKTKPTLPLNPVAPFPIAAVVSAVLMAGAGSALAQAQPPANVGSVVTPPIPSDAAAREVLRLSAEETTLRLGGMDVFPHVAGMVRYDDNVLISHSDRFEDVRWTLAPGVSVIGGDVATYVPGSITVDQLRQFLYYSVVENVSLPKRFVAADYTPAFNVYTKESDFNHIDHSAKLSAGYAFTRLAIGFDADFEHADIKNNSVGTLLTTDTYGAQVRARYDLSVPTWIDGHAGFRGIDYDGPYQGYDEPELGLQVNRQFTEKLSAGFGALGGITLPESSEDQCFEQLLANATYRSTGKLVFNAAAGVEFRQYDADRSDTTHFVFSASGVYQPTLRTSVILEGHRRDEPSPFADYNYETLGGSLGVRQELHTHLSAGASLGYDFVKYRASAEVADTDREDDYILGRANVSYEFNRHWRATLFYEHRRQESQDDNLSYFNNLVGLEVFWRF